jgi:hypothetical protein
MMLAKKFLINIIALLALVGSPEIHAQTTQERQLDQQRGLRNYQDVMGGRKKLEQLSPQERQEVLVIFRRIKSKSDDGKTSECKDARDRAATAAVELADRSRKLRSCAEAEDYSEDCSTEFRRVKNVYSDYEDAVSTVRSYCN